VENISHHERKASTKATILWKLFINMLYISSVTFGGGFVIVNFIKKTFVEKMKWITEDEMLDMIALAQSSPGAIAVNTAILMGWNIAGFWGMVAAVLGIILPPMTIITVISFFYEAFIANKYIALMLKGMQAGVAALILDVAFDLTGKLAKRQRPIYVILMALAFILVFLAKVNVVLIILPAALIGFLVSLLDRKRVLLP
jgi:chromate transporter